MSALSLDHWFKLAQIVTALIFGGAAVIVSYQQLRIAKIKQRLELYDRRLTILNRTRDYTSKVLNSSSFCTEDVVEYQNSMSEARFLFGDNINKKIEWLKRVGFEIDMQNIYMEEMRTGGHVPNAPKSPAKEKARLKNSLLENEEELFELFREYMKLDS